MLNVNKHLDVSGNGVLLLTFAMTFIVVFYYRSCFQLTHLITLVPYHPQPVNEAMI